MPGEDDTNYKTDDYCGLYLGNASTVPLCVQICVIIDTRWDHELKHEWVLIRRSLSMSSIVQNLYYCSGEEWGEGAANEVASGNTVPMQNRVDNDRFFSFSFLPFSSLFFFFHPIPPPRIAPPCPIGNAKRGSLYAAIPLLSSFIDNDVDGGNLSFLFFFSPKETIRVGKG